MTHKYKTRAILRANIFKPDKVAINLSQKALAQYDLNKDLLPQSDLLYVRSVLVTAGMNGNDDVFYNKELWKARFSPILKPMNWRHDENEIVGVMYNVVARDLNTDEIIPLKSESYDKPFELITEGVVYKLLFPERASEIVEKSQANELFVSMETWFDDYDYAIFQDNILDHIIQRNSETAFLDQKLRAFSGDGVLDLPNGVTGRIGRGLRNLNFGGCGFVERPANDRSFIESVGNDKNSADKDKLNSRILELLNVLDSDEISVNSYKEVAMTDKVVTKAEIQTALQEHEAQKAAEQEQAELVEKAEKADALEQEVNKMRSAFKTINEKLGNMLGRFTDSMKVVEKTLGEAPPEIKKIDKADSPEALFQAKISWIEKSIAFLAKGLDKLEKMTIDAEEMRKKLDEMSWQEKSEKVKGLLGNYVAEDKLEEMLNIAKEMDEDVFDKWFTEKEMLVASITSKTESESESEVESEDQKEKSKEEAGEKEEEEKEEKSIEGALDAVEVEDRINVSNASHDVEKNNPWKKVVAEIYSKNEEKQLEKAGFDPVE